jgi:hypothetical protein
MFAAETAPHPRRGVARVIKKTLGDNRRPLDRRGKPEKHRIGPESTIGGEKGKVVRGLRPRSKLESSGSASWQITCTVPRAIEAVVGRSGGTYGSLPKVRSGSNVIPFLLSRKWTSFVHCSFAAYLVVFVVVVMDDPCLRDPHAYDGNRQIRQGVGVLISPVFTALPRKCPFCYRTPNRSATTAYCNCRDHLLL